MFSPLPPPPVPHTQRKYVNTLASRKCRGCQCFLRASARRETFTQVDTVDHQDWHIGTCTCMHANTRTRGLLVFIPVGVELSISWADSLLFTLSSLSILSSPSSAPIPSCPLHPPCTLSAPFPLLSPALPLPVGLWNPTLLVTGLNRLKHEKF